MNKKQDNLILFCVIGLGLGLIGFSTFKFLNKPIQTVKAIPVQPVQSAQPIKQEPAVKNRHNNKVSVLNEYHLFKYDITSIVPYGAGHQLALWRYVRDAGQNWNNRNQDCQTDNIVNSFEQSALGFHLQAHGNYKSARQCYLFAAEKGNAYAANRLGELYLLGLGGEKNLEQAKFWLEKSANAGYYFAEFNLGLMYLDIPLNSKTLDIDPTYSILINKQKLHYMKVGAKADLEKAKYWLSRSVRQNGGEPKILMQYFNMQLYTGDIENVKNDVDFQSKINHQIYYIKSENLPNRYPSNNEKMNWSNISLYTENGVVHFHDRTVSTKSNLKERLF